MSQEAVGTQTVCYNHPNRETMLRCNRCERPICTECAVLTPTGYRCKGCIQGQLKVYDTAKWWDYPLAMITGAGLSFVGSWAAQFLGFFVIFIGPIAGVIIAESIRWVVRRRRARRLYQLAAASVVIGALPLILYELADFLIWGVGGFNFLGLIWPLVYAFLVTSTAFYRLSGIQIR
jgi:hypothetical protein